MGSFYDRADDITSRIQTVYDDSELRVITDRQKDLRQEVAGALNKTKGGAAVVEWTGAPSVNPDLDELQCQSNYSVSIACVPILRDRESRIEADVLVETIATSLHGWNPDTQHCQYEIKVTSIQPIPDPEFLIYKINLTQKLNVSPT